ncbi:hypothetical protein DOO74_15985 [Rhodobacteraceae bacterium AsT-22]|nr:hypothetical protein DOO74_15985 [Rhodobacteraceae bacterium AsT-22]
MGCHLGGQKAPGHQKTPLRSRLSSMMRPASLFEKGDPCGDFLSGGHPVRDMGSTIEMLAEIARQLEISVVAEGILSIAGLIATGSPPMSGSPL